MPSFDYPGFTYAVLTSPRIKELAAQTRELHVIFNNCYDDKAIRNARQMSTMFDGAIIKAFHEVFDDCRKKCERREMGGPSRKTRQNLAEIVAPKSPRQPDLMKE